MMSKLYFFVLVLLAGRLAAQPIATADFNSGLTPGWTVTNGGTTPDTWYVTTGGAFAGNTLNGSNFAFVNSDAAGNSPTIILSERLQSPVFNGNAYGQVFLEFDHFYRDFSLDTGWVEVYNGSAWIPLAHYSSNTGAWSAPAHATFNLTPYRNPNMQVRFRYEDNAIWAWYWAVDNVQLYAPAAFDASITALNTPTGTCGLGTAEPISIEVRNDGSATLTSLPVRYRVNGGPIVSETITASIPPAGTLAYTFTTPVNMSAAGAYAFDAWTSLPGDADPSGDSLLGTLHKNHVRISSFPYHEDFESGQGSWFPVGVNSTWAYGTPAKTVIQGASSGQNAWTTGGLTGDYVNFENSQLEGPCFDLTALTGPWFGTDIWWNAEWSWDGAALQASVDGGLTWTTVGAYGDPYNWYNDNTIDALPGGQNNGWTGRAASNDGSGGYVRAAHSLANWSANNEVILRVAFATDNSVIDDGIAFDDITIAAQPILYLGPDTIACDSFLLDGGPASQYTWSTGDSSQSILITQSGTYNLQIRDQYGFPAGDVIQVTVQGPGNWTLGQDTFLCRTQPYTLSGPAGASSFLWSTGDTSTTIQATATGNYHLLATYSAGCTARDTLAVTFSTLQAQILLPGDTLCRGQISGLQSASPGASTYWWDFGNGSFSSNANPVTVYTAGGTFTITLVVSDALCSDTSSRVVFVDLCTGLDAGQFAGWTLSPNPASAHGGIHLSGHLDSPSPLSCSLHDSQGRQLRTWQIQGPGSIQTPVPIAGLANGTYFLRLDDQRAQRTIPFVLLN
jgi:PKD domain